MGPDVISLLLCIPTLALAAPSPFRSSTKAGGAVARAGVIAASPYAPVEVACPSSPLVRPANGISSAEAVYIQERKRKASAALKRWLARTGAGFADVKEYPTVALSTSGGGLRSLLSGAGVHQAFDDRDSSFGTSGLYQALTYESGLSGGGWLLGSISGNNWPTISSLQTNLWDQTFDTNLSTSNNPVAAAFFAGITNDIVAKEVAGFPPTLADPYGRVIGHLLLQQADGGVMETLSGLASLSNFTCHEVPYPITTAIGVDTQTGQCIPTANNTQYELHPYEFGSWDQGVHAFAQTHYLGSSINNGGPSMPGKCIANYDNLGYVMGTTSDLFNQLCGNILPTSTTPDLQLGLEAMVAKAHPLTPRDEYAAYPNPFHGHEGSAEVSSLTELELVDGGETSQNDPIWPMLYRSVDVLIVNDNSADTADNFPNGTELYHTYLRSRAVGLARMPTIPPAETFVAEGLNRRPTFFGCEDKSAMTIVFLPNVNYTYPSGQSSFRLQYDKASIGAMIENGNAIATYAGAEGFGTCVGCAIMKKGKGKGKKSRLPKACEACLSKFCYN